MKSGGDISILVNTAQIYDGDEFLELVVNHTIP